MSQPFDVNQHIFDKEYALTDDWDPEGMPEREQELEEIHNALKPAIRSENMPPENMFLFGKTGQGKTAAMDLKLEQLQEAAQDSDFDVTAITHNCAGDSTSYQVLTGLVKQLTGTSPVGHQTSEVLDRFFDAVAEIGGKVVVVLDEIDTIGTDDLILYELPRASTNGQIPEDMNLSIVGISNNFTFRDNLSSQVRDTLFDKEIHFSPYNATQLQSILERRANVAFHDDVLESDVIPLVSAWAAKDKGSARQALDFLYTSGHIASSRGDETVTTEHAEEAKEAVKRDNLRKGIRDMTLQDQMTLLALARLEIVGETPASVTEVRAEHKKVAQNTGTDPLTERSIREHLLDIDLMGVIQSDQRKTPGRGPPEYTFEVTTSMDLLIDALSEGSSVSEDDVVDLVTQNKSLSDYID